MGCLRVCAAMQALRVLQDDVQCDIIKVRLCLLACLLCCGTGDGGGTHGTNSVPGTLCRAVLCCAACAVCARARACVCVMCRGCGCVCMRVRGHARAYSVCACGSVICWGPRPRHRIMAVLCVRRSASFILCQPCNIICCTLQYNMLHLAI